MGHGTGPASSAGLPALPTGFFVGTCGWSYPEWADDFYAGVPRRDWLAHYAERFNAVEVDASFYHSLRRVTYAGWRERTPAGFRFVVKANRFLTHVRRLDFGDDSLARERDAMAGLGDKLALVLWQLPAALRADLGCLHAFLKRLAAWSGTRHALEFRHASWFSDEVAATLAAHGVAVCQSDAPDWPLWSVMPVVRGGPVSCVAAAALAVRAPHRQAQAACCNDRDRGPSRNERAVAGVRLPQLAAHMHETLPGDVGARGGALADQRLCADRWQRLFQHRAVKRIQQRILQHNQPEQRRREAGADHVGRPKHVEDHPYQHGTRQLQQAVSDECAHARLLQRCRVANSSGRGTVPGIRARSRACDDAVGRITTDRILGGVVGFRGYRDDPCGRKSHRT